NGPLKTYYHSGNIIPQLINPFLDIHAILTYGLADEGLIDPVDQRKYELDEDDISQ
ncbi:hypothetical protein C0991_003215, partial [Blastosporella zonata]